jgi:hypothetical protein
LITHFRLTFAQKSLSQLLLPINSRPEVPVEYVDPQGAALNLDAIKLNMQIRSEARRVNDNYQQGTSLIVSKLAGNPMTDVITYINSNHTPRVIFNLVVARLQLNYNQNGDSTILLLIRKVETCPPVATYDESELFFALIAEIDVDLTSINPARAFTESQKRTFCFQKLGSLFNTLVEKIEEDPALPMTFAQISQSVIRMQELARIRGSGVSLTSHSSPSTVQHADMPHDISGDGSSNSLVNSSVAQGGAVCKNCGAGHYLRECLTMCTSCAPTARPHHPFDCPV